MYTYNITLEVSIKVSARTEQEAIMQISKKIDTHSLDSIQIKDINRNQ